MLFTGQLGDLSEDYGGVILIAAFTFEANINI
jgi:hypothetical protein